MVTSDASTVPYNALLTQLAISHRTLAHIKNVCKSTMIFVKIYTYNRPPAHLEDNQGFLYIINLIVCYVLTLVVKPNFNGERIRNKQ